MAMKAVNFSLLKCARRNDKSDTPSKYNLDAVLSSDSERDLLKLCSKVESFQEILWHPFGEKWKGGCRKYQGNRSLTELRR
jgi:hypothetical protein